MMKALITGAAGQDGVYLSQYLQTKNCEIIPIVRSSGVNFLNYREVKELVHAHRPSHIFHLAANSTTRHEAWEENHDVIVNGTQYLLESVYSLGLQSKVFLAGSGLQFENTGNPIKETDSFTGNSLYSVQRNFSVMSARYYRSLGIPVYVGYFFNHDSPLRGERHINSKIIAAAKKIQAGSTEPLVVGDPSVEKEFGFAGDIVKGMLTLVGQEEVFEAVIGTGNSYPISKWIEIVFKHFQLDPAQYVQTDPDYRPEYRRLVSDPSTINKLGWSHETSIDQLAKQMLGL